MELPIGTVTFLFTDLERSTRLWEEQPEESMSDALARHDTILRDAVERHGGLMISAMGDGVAAVFASAPEAVAAAFEAQSELETDDWGKAGLLRARMGLHTDEGRLRAPGEYVNRPLNRCARLMAAAHGGQILLSEATAVVARRALPEQADVSDLGEHYLRDLAEPVRVFQLTHAQLRTGFPPLRSLSTTPGNLPRQVTTFVGREEEMSRVVTLVRERPIVTLTGVGGVGKTRLALEVAAEIAPDLPGGAWLCELAAVTDPDSVWSAIASSLGVQPSAARPLDATVLEYLAASRSILLLDNCEHLLDAVAHAVDAISRQCPDVAILVTSREGLALAGEHLVAVPALGVPADSSNLDALESSDAVRLFCDRARDAQAEFILSAANADAVAQICRRLDGIPLAIELAAARVRSLRPEDIVARLDQQFRLLTRGNRAALERHQTLRNTIDWSYDLLTRSEQLALSRLSVFAGGWDLDAAEAILSDDDSLDARDVVDVLGQLVDKSLVLVDLDGGKARYRMLEMIRQYAQEKLEASGETAAVRQRHAEHFIAVSETAGPHLRTRDQLEWAAHVVRDSENLRAALDWAVETGSPEHALRIVAPLMVTGMPIGWNATDWAELAQGVPGAEAQELYPMVAAFAALGAAMRGDVDRAGELAAKAQRAQAELGTAHMWVHTAAGVSDLFRGDLDSATRHAREWEQAARASGDPYEIAHALILLASAMSGDPERARPLADEAVSQSRDAGISSALIYAIIVRVNFGDLDPATVRELAEEGLHMAVALGDRSAAGGFMSMRGFALARAGDWRAALRAYVESVEEQMQATTRPWPGGFGLATIALERLGDLETAAVIRGYTDGQRLWNEAPAEFVADIESVRAVLVEQLGTERVEELMARGANLSDDEAFALMREAAERVLAE